MQSHDVQKFFSIQESKYDMSAVRGSLFKKPKRIKRRSVSVVGLKLWNSTSNLKMCITLRIRSVFLFSKLSILILLYS